mmetsp:Transcript_3263/g.5720  ORF Transcript_3263/g.5720 Transcript_3263/m.5720 type:complete len:1095 (-) Transcript_3263:208-3492(-)
MVETNSVIRLGSTLVPTWNRFGWALFSGFCLWIFLSLVPFVVVLFTAAFPSRLERQLKKIQKNEQTEKSQQALSRIRYGGLRKEKFLRAQYATRKWRLRNKLRLDAKLGVLPYIASFIINLICVLVFIKNSFDRYVGNGSAVVFLIAAIWFTTASCIQYVFLPFPKQKLWHNFFSFSLICNALSIPSLWGVSFGHLSFLNLIFVRVMSAFYSMSRIFFPAREPDGPLPLKKPSDAYMWFAFFAALFFVLSSSMYVLETLGNPKSSWDASTDDFNSFNGIYFMLVTMTTVGYGDFLPTFYTSVIFVTLAILTALFYFGWRIGQLLDVLSSLKSGEGTYESRDPHVLVIGRPSCRDFKAFLNGIQNSAYQFSIGLKVVLMCTKLDWTEADFTWLMEEYRGTGVSVTYLNGTVFLESDRARAKLDRAKAVFCMASALDSDTSAADEANIMRVAVVRDQEPETPIYAAVVSPDLLVQLRRSICVQTFHATSSKSQLMTLRKNGNWFCTLQFLTSILTTSVRVPGLGTLLSGLILNLTPNVLVDDLPWQEEFKRGCAMSVRMLKLSSAAVGLNAFSLARNLFLRFGVVLVSVISRREGPKLIIDLNRKLDEDDVAVQIICSDDVYEVLRVVDWFDPVDTLENELEFRSSIKTILNDYESSHEISSSTQKTIKEKRETHERESMNLESFLTTEFSDSKQPSLDEITGHILILAYSIHSLSRVRGIVESFRMTSHRLAENDPGGLGQYTDEPAFLCVVSGLDSETIETLQEEQPGVSYFPGDPSNGKLLVRMNAGKSRCIVVIPDASKGTDAVSSNVLFTLFALQSMRTPSSTSRILLDSIPVSAVGVFGGKAMDYITRAGYPEYPADQNYQERKKSQELNHEKLSETLRRRKPFTAAATGGFSDGAHSVASERYASGEILIPSVGSALLAGDFLTPGLIWLMMSFCGASREGDYLKLHLWNIPESWKGRKYAEVAVFLFGRNVIPLGLFRCGAAPVHLTNLRKAKNSTGESKYNAMLRQAVSSDNVLADETASESLSDDSFPTPPTSALVEDSLAGAPYVVTNPELYTVVSDFDSVYVLCSKSKSLVDLHKNLRKEDDST